MIRNSGSNRLWKEGRRRRLWLNSSPPISRRIFGPIGAVTWEIAEQLQRTHFLNPVAVDSAISQAGLAVVETIDIPESPPIPQFKRLSDDMSKVPVKSVPELIHPTVGEFTLVDRFASASDAGYRMDLPAIEARAKALNRKAGTDSDLAAESACGYSKASWAAASIQERSRFFT